MRGERTRRAFTSRSPDADDEPRRDTIAPVQRDLEQGLGEARAPDEVMPENPGHERGAFFRLDGPFDVPLDVNGAPP